MHRIRLAGASLLLTAVAGCGIDSYHSTTAPSSGLVGSGRFVTESRPVAAVTHVVATAALRVIVAHTGTPALDITAEDNILPLIDIVERDGVLTAGWKPSPGGVSTHGVEIRLGVRELRVAEASGASRVDVDGIATRDFTIGLAGAAQFSGNGVVEQLHLDVAGASRVQAAALSAGSVTARVSGASSAQVRVGDSLVATVSGSSLLEFFGNPSVHAAVSDTSIVRRIGP